MLAGCVPVVADGGGPGFMVTEDCGFKIPVSSRRRMVAQLAETLIAIDRDRKLFQKRGGWPRGGLPRPSRRRITGKPSMRHINLWRE